ncbi:hypothetical protein VaNZ11_011414 [Volvox africanus]|uniref:Uncharacterized protein n=1 Tax=Volvox africanus TaxID=51714 RepID=A0ABQ5SCR9_9CHLO|nr:hypothetical protein VaNZ11_011414 [Volvox africanus]
MATIIITAHVIMYPGRSGVRNIPRGSSLTALLDGNSLPRYKACNPGGIKQYRCPCLPSEQLRGVFFPHSGHTHSGGGVRTSRRKAHKHVSDDGSKYKQEFSIEPPLEDIRASIPVLLDADNVGQCGGSLQQQQEAVKGMDGIAHEHDYPTTIEIALGNERKPELQRGYGWSRPRGSWCTLALVPAVIWGPAWAATMGLVSVGYAALATAAAIAAAAFGSLVPGAAMASRLGTAGTSGTAAVVATVDWVDVALRTAVGLTSDIDAGVSGAAGRVQVLTALQEAGSGPVTAWAVTSVLPGLCALAGGCRAAVAVVRMELPWLEPLAQLAAAAAGLGVLLLLAMPLRRYLAPLLPVLPRESPSGSAWAALRAGGTVCMVAVLTSLQAQELVALPLTPSSRGAVIVAVMSSPLLLQTHSVLYGVASASSDVVLPLCTAAVAARAAYALLVQRQSAEVAGFQVGRFAAAAQGQALTATCGPDARPSTLGNEVNGAVFKAVKMLAASRLVLDALVLFAIATGALPGKVSAMRLLGMLWLLETTSQL